MSGEWLVWFNFYFPHQRFARSQLYVCDTFIQKIPSQIKQIKYSIITLYWRCYFWNGRSRKS
jgi:hypothetical protein